MYQDAKAANMAAYLLSRAGAGGLSRRRLAALMYLAERNELKRCGVPSAHDDFMLTEQGPVMKHAYARIMGAPQPPPKTEDDEEANREWGRIVAAEEPAMVADTDAAYAERPPAARALERLALRRAQPVPTWDDGTPLDSDVWFGKDEGIPYLGELSQADHWNLADIWRIHGERDEDDLIQHMLELPERGNKVSGDLPFSTILKTLGYTAREIKETLDFVKELDGIDRLAASMRKLGLRQEEVNIDGYKVCIDETGSGGFCAYFAEFDTHVVLGDTFEEARDRMREELPDFFQEMRNQGLPVPQRLAPSD